MDDRLRISCHRAGAWLIGRAAASWQERRLRPRRVPAGIGVPILPSAQLRRMQSAFRLLVILYVLELALRGHWLVAGALTAATATVELLRRGKKRALPAQRLLLSADGRLHLLRAGRAVEEVQIDPASLRLGPWLVLRVAGPSGASSCLWFGTDNLDPATLSALRRRLVLVDLHAEAIAPGLGHRIAPAARRPPPA